MPPQSVFAPFFQQASFDLGQQVSGGGINEAQKSFELANLGQQVGHTGPINFQAQDFGMSPFSLLPSGHSLFQPQPIDNGGVIPPQPGGGTPPPPAPVPGAPPPVPGAPTPLPPPPPPVQSPAPPANVTPISPTPGAPTGSLPPVVTLENYLSQAKFDLENQVATGGLHPALALFELSRLAQEAGFQGNLGQIQASNFGQPATSLFGQIGQVNVQPNDQGGFTDAVNAHAQAGTQMSPTEAAQFGITGPAYAQLYGNTAWYTADGALTSNAPSYLQPDAPPGSPGDIQFPEFVAPELVDTSAGFDFGSIPLVTANFQNIPRAPSFEDFLPEEGIEFSPIFEAAKEEGLRELEQLMAARGLTASGAEIEANDRFIRRLLAEETERAAGRATEQAQRQHQKDIQQAQLGNQTEALNVNAANSLNQIIAKMQQGAAINAQEFQILKAAAENAHAVDNANRFTQVGQDEADRQEREGNEAFDRLITTIQQALALNPLSGITSSLTQLSNIIGQQGAAQSALIPGIVDNGAGSQGGSSGGGGGGGFLPSIPSQPNFNNLLPVEAGFDLNNTVATNNLISNIIGQLFPGSG